MAINNVVLVGRITHDLEIKSTASGIEFLNFSIAVDRRYQSKNEEKQTDFIDCTAWRQTAVFIGNYFSKGSMIALTGEIQTRNYEDRNGNKRKAVEIAVDTVSFCGSKSENGSAGNRSAGSAPSTNFNANLDVSAEGFQEVPDDNLPF